MSSPLRPAARLLLIESAELLPLLRAAPADEFDRPTVCTGWTVRDVLAHCSAALTATASGELHGFTPDDNERDVAARRSWPLERVLAELADGYAAAAGAIDAAAGALDGIGLGEWVHGGDVREPLGAPDPYASAGVELALPLLAERSRLLGAPGLHVEVDDIRYEFGRTDPDRAPGALRTDTATFVRLCGGRRPDPGRFELAGAEPAELILFT